MGTPRKPWTTQMAPQDAKMNPPSFQNNRFGHQKDSIQHSASPASPASSANPSSHSSPTSHQSTSDQSGRRQGAEPWGSN